MKPSPLLRRGITTKAHILDRELGIVEYVASDNTLDGDHEVTLVDGWDFSRMEKNAPFIDSHRQDSIEHVLGKVIGGRVEKGQLVETVQWAVGMGRDLADIGFKMTEAGFLRGVSVGFIALEEINVKTTRDFHTQALALGVAVDDLPDLQTVYKRQQQIELSAVVVGSNPNALVKAFAAGAIVEKDLAAIGFGGDDEYAFLQQECTAVLKSMIGLEMGRLFAARRKTLSETTKRTATDASPCTPSGGLDVERKVAQRQEFLEQLATLGRR
jgi:hypothetical protein